MKTIQIKLTFDDLRRNGVRIDSEDFYIATRGNMHSGATFPGTITLDEDAETDFQAMLDDELQVVFWVMK